MAADFAVSNATASAMADALVDRIDITSAGSLKGYTATRAVTVDTAIGAQTLLFTCTFGATAFGAASNGVATANAITQDSSADATNTADWFRIANGAATAIADGNIGVSSTDLQLNTVSIVTGAVVSISAGSITVPLT
jgi:hypothetical protein